MEHNNKRIPFRSEDCFRGDPNSNHVVQLVKSRKGWSHMHTHVPIRVLKRPAWSSSLLHQHSAILANSLSSQPKSHHGKPNIPTTRPILSHCAIATRKFPPMLALMIFLKIIHKHAKFMQYTELLSPYDFLKKFINTQNSHGILNCYYDKLFVIHS